jgi:hypothetical protein
MKLFYVISLVLTLTACTCTLTRAQAAPVLLGKFDKVSYVYDDSAVYSEGDMRFVWIASSEKKFNHKNDKDYVGIMGRYVIDCNNHTSSLIGGMIIGENYVILRSVTIPIEHWNVVNIQEHTPQYALHLALCNSASKI